MRLFCEEIIMACTHASTHTLAADGGTHHANASPSSTHRTTKPYSSLSSRPLPHAPARPSRPLSLSSGQTSACEHTLFHVTRARALVYRACVGQVFGGVGVWAVMQRPEAAFWLTNPALRIQVASGPPTLLARTMPLCSLVDPGLVSGPSGCKDMMR